jgi:excisionase family DNA binding protein
MTDLITRDEAARRLGISRQSIMTALREGRLRGFEIGGGKILLHAAEVDAYVPAGPHLKPEARQIAKAKQERQRKLKSKADMLKIAMCGPDRPQKRKQT